MPLLTGSGSIEREAIFRAADREQATALLKTTIEKYADTAPRLTTWMEQNLEEGFTVFDFPAVHRRHLRTSNSLERVNEEIYRRTRVGRIIFKPTINSLNHPFG